MQKKIKNRVYGTIFTIIILIAFLQPFVVMAEETPLNPIKSDIVFVIDVSGSMVEIDSGFSFRDALLLGVDLAPEHSRVGIVAVDNAVVSEFPLTDVSGSEDRTAAKKHVHSIQKGGNTNFLPGLERAVEMLEISNAAQKRIVFLGDFQEGGLNTDDPPKKTAEAIGVLSNRAKELGIMVDMLLTGSPPQNSVTAPQYTSIPGTTGGSLHEVAAPVDFPASVEHIYFKNYTYFQNVYTLKGKDSQNIQISIPTEHAQRARIYVSASEPPASFGATYAGAALDGETTASYAMLHFDKPSKEGVSITLTPGSAETAYIYLLLGCDIKLSVTFDSETELPDKAKEYVQTTSIRAEIVDSQTGEPLVPTPFPDNVSYSVSIAKPDGQPLEDYISDDSTMYRFNPKDEADFGNYTISAKLNVGEFVFEPKAQSILISDVRPIIEPVNWALYLAIGIAGLLILSAIIFAMRHKKKESVYQGAVEMASDYRFHGKLSIYAVMLDGGNRELPPFDFGMYGIAEKRITLREILDSGGAKGVYQGAENILLLVGPEESLIVRNNSQAIIRVMGREYGYQTKFQIFYGQKIYAVFQQDEDELEMTYRQTREEVSTPIHFHMRSR